jgi:tRNA and rRNA cytosine-C5-methylases
MNGLPDYAVINNHVELIKQLGKQQLAGFMNAVLRAARDEKYEYPLDSDVIKYNSVKFSKPEWLVEKLINDYGFEVMCEILSAEPLVETHIRPNLNVWDADALEEFLITRNFLQNAPRSAAFW